MLKLLAAQSMKMDDNGSDVGVEQVAKDAMIKVTAVQRLLGAPRCCH